MRPNQEQLQFIKAQLAGVLTVRETYDEVYDHILCALDEMPDEVLFVEAMNEIWEHDLGGKRGIRRMQRKCTKAAISQFFNAYVFYFLKSFKSAYLIVVIAITIGFYLLVKAEKLDPRQIVLLSLLSLVIAAITLRLTKKAPQWERPKVDFAVSHIKGYAMAVIINLPQLLWLLISGFCRRLDKSGIIEWMPNSHGDIPVNIATAFFFLMLMHAVTYYQLYKNTQPKTIVT